MEISDELKPYHDMIEGCIRELGVEPVGCRGEKPGQWNLRKGSARVWLDLWYSSAEERPYYQVMSPVLPLPTQNREAFFQELLELNDRLFGVAFSLHRNWAWLKAIREVEAMDPSEALAMIVRVGRYADQYDDYLAEEYGVQRPVPGQSADDEFPQAPGHPETPPHGVN